MAYQQETIQPKEDFLLPFEKKLLDILVENLAKPYCFYLKNQIPYFKSLLRLEFKNNSVLEVYPEFYGAIPEEYLWKRKEEFEFAKLYFEINNKSYSSTFRAVNGRLFDLNIKPKIFEDNVDIKFESLKINKDLDENVYEKRKQNGQKIRDEKL